MQETVKLSQLRPGKNPRQFFDEAEMRELEASVRGYGVIQAILVRPADGDGIHEIIFGERRYRAAKAVFGDDYDMPINIKDYTEADAEAVAIIENVQRAQMSVAEEARAAKKLLCRTNDREETALALGWSTEKLASRLALTACSEAVLRALTERRILIGHAELLAGVPPATQDSVLKGILEHKVPVHTLKEQLGQFARRLAEAIFDTAQCNRCPHNSAQQSELFGESLGAGYCQHPTHFDELTLAAITAQAEVLKEEFPVVRIIRKEDGFEPLHVSADGLLGVGAEQYQACRGCQSFGCAVSNMPGSHGTVAASLCFDAVCNSKKVAAQRKAEREANEASKAAASAGAAQASGKTASAGASTREKAKPSNQTPPRVLQYRVEQWRKWAANSLMNAKSGNQRVLIALAMAGLGREVSVSHYGDAVRKITGNGKAGGGFKAMLEAADGFSADKVEALLLAITASASFGVDEVILEVLLNYLDVDEALCFRLNQEFLDLFTKSELESLAVELKLKAALGERFGKLREGKREAFIAALLSVNGFEYQGVVPKVMRYSRKPLRRVSGEREKKLPPAPAVVTGQAEVSA